MSLTVALAGDTMLGRKVGERLARPGHRSLAAAVQEIAGAADLFIANLECCISDRGARVREPGKPFYFRAPPVAAERLANMGVNCVSLANNHALDFGSEALQDTLDHLRGAGIAAVGAGCDEAAARPPVVLDASGVRVRIVAVSDHPSSYAAGAQRPGIAFADLAGAPVPPWLRIASTPDADVDMTIVLPHWGPNMRASPVPHVRRAAATLQAAGATLIAGHSAHVPQGASGRTLFDLGDFIDDYAVDPGLRNDLGVLWLVTLDADGPRRVEGVPLRLEFAHTRLAGRDDTRLLHSLLRERYAAVGSGVHRQGDRLIFELHEHGDAAQAGRLRARARRWRSSRKGERGGRRRPTAGCSLAWTAQRPSRYARSAEGGALLVVSAPPGPGQYRWREVPTARALVVPYDDAWVPRASGLIAGLRSALGPTALRIDHIGSTAIPGMAAKDVIDLQVSVEDLDAAQQQFDAPLRAEGFERLPYDRDHVPAGVDDQPAGWAKRFWSRRGHADGDVNLHVRLAGSPNERLALLFRDWLRTQSAAVPAYAAFKLALAQAVTDVDAYTEIKDPVVDLVMTVAEPWARETGWTP